MKNHAPKLCAVFALSLSLAACQRASTAEVPTQSTSEMGLLPADDVDTSESIFLLSTRFVDQRGDSFDLESLRGGPVLISMFYASCPHACPAILQKMKLVESKLPEEQRDKLRVVLVSFDAEGDTSGRLMQMGELHGVDQSRWRLAHADELAVRELAAVLGIRYKQASDGAIAHSSVITLTDGNGLILERMTTLHAPIERMVSVLTETSEL